MKLTRPDHNSTPRLAPFPMQWILNVCLILNKKKSLFCFVFFSAKTKCMKAKPDCDYLRAKCSTIKNADGKESYSCHCKAGYTGKSTNCVGKEPAVNFQKARTSFFLSLSFVLVKYTQVVTWINI